jgi:phosphate-selective porin OprO and OprP
LVFIFASLIAPLYAAETVPAVDVGYQDGFYMKTPDNRFVLKVGSRLDFGYTYGFIPANDFSSFDIYHAKLYAGGNAFGPHVQYYFQAGAGSHNRSPSFAPVAESTDGGFTLEDYYVRLANDNVSLQLGQYKTPYGREWMIYSGNLNLVDRSIVTKYFTFGRDRGASLHHSKETFALTGGIFNGGGVLQPFDTNGQNRSNDGKGHLYLMRVVAMPWGPVGYSEGDVYLTDGSRLDIGFGFAFDQSRDLDFNGDGIVEDTGAHTWNMAGDLTWKANGASFQSEFFYRSIDTTASIQSMGFYVQPAIFVRPGRLEFSSRFGWLDPDTDAGNDVALEAQAAFNLYFFGDHRYKTQLQYTWRGQETALGGRMDSSWIDLLFQFTI